jgi:hypothetical protein
MLKPVCVFSPRIQPRCPECHCFVRLDAGTCTACGFAFALGIEARRAETTRFIVGSVHESPTPLRGNAQAFTNLQPDGKIKRKKFVCDFEQMDLFQGVL